MSEGFFEDITSLLEDNPRSLTRGVSLFDFDGDCLPEVLFANQGEKNGFLSFRSGSLKPLDSAEFQMAESHTWGLIPGDFLGTGLACVYATNSEVNRGIKKQRDALWVHRKVSGSFGSEEILFENILPLRKEICHTYSSRSVLSLDLKGNGRHSFLVSCRGAPSFFISYDRDQELFGSRMFPDAGKGNSESDRVDLGALCAQSVLSHNSLDLLACGPRGKVGLFSPTRSGKHRNVSHTAGFPRLGVEASGLVLADLEGSGRFDLLLTSFEGHPKVFSHSQDIGFVDRTPFVLAAGLSEDGVSVPGMSTCVVADLDNDGLDEVFFNNPNGPNRLFRYVLHRGWLELALGDTAFANFEGTGAAVGDVDGDGQLELFVGNGWENPQINTALKAHSNHVANNRWLRVQPLNRHGFPALGARVRLLATGVPRPKQLKVLSCGDGFVSFHEPVAHFGLGSEGVIQRLEVYWPGNGVGIPYTCLQGPIEANQTLRLYPPADFSI